MMLRSIHTHTHTHTHTENLCPVTSLGLVCGYLSGVGKKSKAERGLLPNKNYYHLPRAHYVCGIEPALQIHYFTESCNPMKYRTARLFYRTRIFSLEMIVICPESYNRDSV